MNDGLIPGRYAKALLKYANDESTQARLYELMETLSRSFKDNPELNAAISNPFIKPDVKSELLMTAAGATVKDKAYVDFVKLLIQNNRLADTRNIALAFLALYRQANNIFLVDITSAAPLEPSELQRLEAIIKKQVEGAKVEYNLKVDPELIGGFVVNIGSERLDASVKNELKQLRLKLLSK